MRPTRAIWVALALALAAPFHAFAQDDGEGDDEETGTPQTTQAAPVSSAPLTAIDPSAAAEKTAGARKKEFENKAYRFCHDPEFGKKGTEGTDFCAIFDGTSDEVCPEARKNCPNWVPADECDEDDPDCDFGSGHGKGHADGNGKGQHGTKQGGAGKSRVTRKSSTIMLPRLPPAFGYILIAALVAAVLIWFLRSLKNAGWESDDRELDLAAGGITEAERNLQALPEARARVLLELSGRALSRGDGTEAAILLHLAVLRHLDDEGLARYHPSKTNGDYFRAIKRHKLLGALFRGVANQTERIRFGDGYADAPGIQLLLDDAKRLLVRSAEPKAEPAGSDGSPPPKASPPGSSPPGSSPPGSSPPGSSPSGSSPPIAGAATLLLAGVLALSQSACGGDGNDPAYHNRGPAGMAALPELLRDAGLHVDISRSRLASLPPDVGAVVIRSSAGDPRFWPHALKLDKTLDKNISVVVIDDLWRASFFVPVTATTTADKSAVDLVIEKPSHKVYCTWRVAELESIFGSDRLASTGGSALPSRDPMSGGGTAAIRLPHGRRLIPAGTKTASVSAKELELAPVITYKDAQVLRDGRRAAVAWAADRVEHGTTLAGCIYVFSDRDLFTNASLTREANARFVSAFFASLVSDGRRVVILDRFDPWTASEPSSSDQDKSETPNPTKPLKASNMLPFIAQAMAALIVLYLLIGAAFGPLRDPAVREHKAFIEHVEAIGRQYAKTGIMGLTHASRSLARLVVMRHRDQVRGGSGGSWSAVANHLSQKLDLEEKDVRAALRLGIDGVSELGAPGPDDPSPSSERMLRTLSKLLGGKDEPKKKTRRTLPKLRRGDGKKEDTESGRNPAPPPAS